MSGPEQGGHNNSDIVVGSFIIVCGLAILFAGGACTLGWTGFMFHDSDGSIRFHFDSFAATMLLIGAALLVGGFFCIHTGVRIAAGKYRQKPNEGEEPLRHELPEP